MGPRKCSKTTRIFTLIFTLHVIVFLILVSYDDFDHDRSAKHQFPYFVIDSNVYTSRTYGTIITTDQPILIPPDDHVIPPSVNVSTAHPIGILDDVSKTTHKPVLSSTDIGKVDFSEEYECDAECQRKIQDNRIRHLIDECASNHPHTPTIWDTDGHLREDQKQRLNHLIPVDNSGVIYCYVPKVGCSTWKRILLIAAGYKPEKLPKWDIHPLFGRKMLPLSRYGVTEAERRLKTYKKFIFVREPLERMLSLFLDKSVIKHQFPFNESQFEDFLKHILSKSILQSSPITRFLEEHWVHAAYLCLPCDVNYTFIGRLETSQRDSQYIFENYFTDKNLTLPDRDPLHQTNSADEDIKSYYFDQVNHAVLERIYNRYLIDYGLFGYAQPWFLKDTKF